MLHISAELSIFDYPSRHNLHNHALQREVGKKEKQKKKKPRGQLKTWWQPQSLPGGVEFGERLQLQSLNRYSGQLFSLHGSLFCKLCNDDLSSFHWRRIDRCGIGDIHPFTFSIFF